MKLVVKNSPAGTGRCKRRGLHPWVLRYPEGRAQQPTAVFLSGESCGQRSSVGCGAQRVTQSGTQLKPYLGTHAPIIKCEFYLVKKF